MGKQNGGGGRRNRPQSAAQVVGPMAPDPTDKINEVEHNIFRAIKGELCKLIDRNRGEILQAYKEAIELHNDEDKDKKFKFNIPLRASITGLDPNTYDVETSISFTVKRTDMISVQVKTRDGEDLVDMMERAAAEGEEDEDKDEE